MAERGMMMLELLVALAVFALSTSAIVLLYAGNRFAPGDLASRREARESVEATLERARADETSWTPLSLAYDSPCLLIATAESAFTEYGGRVGTTSASTVLADTAEMRKRGMDCGTAPAPSSGATLRSGSSLAASSTTALDLLDGTAYRGLTEPPYFAISVPSDGGSLVSNGFTLPARPNALDAAEIEDGGTRRRYVYAALDATSSQLAVIDATDPAEPILTESATLRDVDPEGEEPAGWRIAYYGEALYVMTRYTAGRELHIFDAGDPAHPVELGAGTELGITVNAFAVRDEGGRRYLYAAAARDSGEAAVYDITDPARAGAAIEIPASRTDLPGTGDGTALALLGTRLYVGRTTDSAGPELYVLDASEPSRGMPVIGTAETGSSVVGIGAWGPWIAVLSKAAGREASLWDAANAAAMTLVATAPAPRPSAMDLEDATLGIASGSSLLVLDIASP